MNVVPAQAAGVQSLVVASPPQADFGGWPHPTILAACALLGVDEVWAVGGAQGVAPLAYGGSDTDGAELDPVDPHHRTGQHLRDRGEAARAGCRRDRLRPAPPRSRSRRRFRRSGHIAADLISQAEHDVLAASVLVTDSEGRLADAVDEQVIAQAGATKHAQRVAQALTGPQSGIVLVDDLDAGLRVVDEYAAEHLEIQTATPSGRRPCATPALSSSARTRR